jgi:hypothetical protein
MRGLYSNEFLNMYLVFGYIALGSGVGAFESIESYELKLAIRGTNIKSLRTDRTLNFLKNWA